MTITLFQMILISPDEEDEDSSSEFSADEDDDDSQFTPRCLEENNVGASKEIGSFGFWEKHTRGIGSRLMEKMGYVHGSGLGKEGEGRINPVEAMVFPSGRSLGKWHQYE